MELEAILENTNYGNLAKDLLEMIGLSYVVTIHDFELIFIFLIIFFCEKLTA